MNGETGPSISMDFFDNSSGVSVIKLDSDRSVLKFTHYKSSFHLDEMNLWYIDMMFVT